MHTMEITDCRLCPRQCRSDRTAPAGVRRSLCRAGAAAEVSLVSLHPWEEPCLCGRNGAGTVFFTHCNLRCCFCQNYMISAQGQGIPVSDERLAEIFLEQQQRGASCLELVTPSHYVLNIIRALDLARAAGLTLRVVYNSNGYERPDIIACLAGYVDVYMPDLKYFDSALGRKYSGVPDYFEWASRAIQAMVDQVGPVRFDAEGQLVRGVLVRHLVLPWLWQDSCRCVEWLWKCFGDTVCVSLMNQYVPMYRACRHPEINRKLTTLEYQKVVRRARELGLTRCYMQVGQTADEKFVPVFDGANVLPAGDRDRDSVV